MAHAPTGTRDPGNVYRSRQVRLASVPCVPRARAPCGRWPRVFGTSFAGTSAMIRIAVALLVAVAFAPTLHAQVDPVRRDLVEFGYDQPLAGHAPLGGYLFYYLSRPQF